MDKFRIVIETTPSPRSAAQKPHSRALWIALISLPPLLSGSLPFCSASMV
jgi:hypothetical protein